MKHVEAKKAYAIEQYKHAPDFVTFYGGDGSDTYLIRGHAQNVIIGDFNPSEDRIKISAHYDNWLALSANIFGYRQDSIILTRDKKVIVLRDITPDILHSEMFPMEAAD